MPVKGCQSPKYKGNLKIFFAIFCRVIFHGKIAKRNVRQKNVNKAEKLTKIHNEFIKYCLFFSFWSLRIDYMQIVNVD